MPKHLLSADDADWLCWTANKATRSLYRDRDTCIFTTLSLLDVLKERGIEAYPLVVRAEIKNQALVAFEHEHGRLPQAGEGDGCCLYLLGQRDYQDTDPDHWPGHLIAVVQRRHAIDATSDQVQVPVAGLDLPPLSFEVNETFLRGRGAMTTDDVPWGSIAYRAIPGDKSYQGGLAYREPAERVLLAQRIRDMLGFASRLPTAPLSERKS